ncbi:hypothetical protein CLV80_10779 [Yoonia maritima]|uniref:Uncharacterized protein n=1 Tax=Yoonia maritima TaxID=1435347 RepID=A0A2T0VXR9_9RHOB|nr:hypothetical protein [Yoonia maritima]PRY76902.1 hypothetical protein CLV80_10779 [Yoonia maritima]
MQPITPLKNETPLDFVERADELNVDGVVIDTILEEFYSLRDDGEIKKLKLRSAPFWEQFYRNHATNLFQRGAAKYAALNFIRRKNGASGQKMLSDQEIEDLVESVGVWRR